MVKKHNNPHLKKGSTTDPINYRPIAIHSNLYKLWTRCVHRVLSKYADSVGMISKAQEGFQKNHGTGRETEHFVSTCEDARINQKDLFALKLDFASAFNKVDHPRLLFIMEEIGIPTDALSVIKGIYNRGVT